MCVFCDKFLFLYFGKDPIKVSVLLLLCPLVLIQAGTNFSEHDWYWKYKYGVGVILLSGQFNGTAMLVLLLLKQVSFAHAGRKTFGFNSFSRKNDKSRIFIYANF